LYRGGKDMACAVGAAVQHFVGVGVEDDYIPNALRQIEGQADEVILRLISLADNLDNGVRERGDCLLCLLRTSAEYGDVGAFVRAVRELHREIGIVVTSTSARIFAPRANGLPDMI